MFQTVIDENDVFMNFEFYDKSSYYFFDGCIFPYKADSENKAIAVPMTFPASYLKLTEIKEV